MAKRLAQTTLDRRVAAMRRFNRFYTQKIGVLREGLLDSPFSLTEARVLYELANRDAPTAGELAKDLGLDAGYLSRILRRFQNDGLLTRTRSSTDGRQSHLTLTGKGRKAFAPLDRRSRGEIGGLLAPLADGEQQRLLEAMQTIERLLGNPRDRGPLVLRPHRPGDMGWIIQRHAALYAQEYGWDGTFESLVARIAAHFIDKHDPRRERFWIAERDGVIVGSVGLVAKSKTVAKLRLLIIEPEARGLGLGKRLVDECIRFAREAGYREITLWTNDILHAARHIYESVGFRLVSEERHHSFGHDLVGQYWTLKL